jgi:hypothetical protein
VPIAVVNRELKLEEVLTYFLKECNKSYYPCLKPKGGELFMFCYDEEMCMSKFIYFLMKQ